MEKAEKVRRKERKKMAHKDEFWLSCQRCGDEEGGRWFKIAAMASLILTEGCDKGP